MSELPPTPTPIPIKWLGNSKRNLREFPEAVCDEMGYALFYVQCGVTPANAKPFEGVGSGVFELVERHDKNAYEKVYVLHAFQKKSKQGIKTPRADVNLIKQRYKEAQEDAKND